MGLRHGYKQTDIGVIPEDWEVNRLRDLAGLGQGIQIPLEKQYTETGESRIRFLRISDYTMLDEEYRYIEVPSQSNIVEEGYVVMVRYGASAGTVFVSDYGALANNLFFIEPLLHAKLERLFLYYLLTSQTIQSDISNFFASSAMPQVSHKNLYSLQIPLPPTLHEQQAIAQALSDMDAQITAVDALIAKKRALKQATMQDLLTGHRRLPGFGDGMGYKQTEVGVIPEDWEVQTAGEVCTKIQDGTHFSPKLGGSDYLYITSKNIKFGILDISNVDYIDEAEHRSIYSRCDVKKDDLLLTKDGANTGNAAINWLDEEFSLLSSVALMRFPIQHHDVRFYLQFILSDIGQSQIMQLMSGNAITRLTLGKINGLFLPIPKTLAEQRLIATVLSQMDTEITSLETQRDKLTQIKQGMMQELLTGKTRLI